MDSSSSVSLALIFKKMSIFEKLEEHAPSEHRSVDATIWQMCIFCPADTEQHRVREVNLCNWICSQTDRETGFIMPTRGVSQFSTFQSWFRDANVSGSDFLHLEFCFPSGTPQFPLEKRQPWEASSWSWGPSSPSPTPHGLLRHQYQCPNTCQGVREGSEVTPGLNET